MRLLGKQHAQRGLEFRDAALLAADREDLCGKRAERIRCADALADRERFVGQPLGLVDATGEEGAQAVEQAQGPLEERLADSMDDALEGEVGVLESPSFAHLDEIEETLLVAEGEHLARAAALSELDLPLGDG